MFDEKIWTHSEEAFENAVENPKEKESWTSLNQQPNWIKKNFKYKEDFFNWLSRFKPKQKHRWGWVYVFIRTLDKEKFESG